MRIPTAPPGAVRAFAAGVLALVLAGCFPTTEESRAFTATLTGDLSVLTGLPALGSDAAAAPIAGAERRRDGALVRYRDERAGHAFAVCREDGRLAEIAMLRGHPEARRFQSDEGVRFSSSLERARALLAPMGGRTRRRIATPQGGTALVITFPEDSAPYGYREMRYRFDAERLAEVTAVRACGG